VRAYLVAVNLLVRAHHNPESAIADDLSSSIAGVSLPDDYTAYEFAFPLWPVGTLR
jgi:hypothetical protein